ncbi:ABC transporter permease [Roseinatronobacter bogoriensis]|uniref:ABC transporter permease n=1 Tax=Roseinatronobacter bogoriensis subsp. barguzinensis TaxID=441209 RepID=A0A2K8KHN8_9RHOB|nr:MULTISPECIES: ABC transporter permease [Rhodobaca]ATX67493.1 ABC transporter permease [Rhodobaca barguzinensis]MBB4207084.1 ABC-2 type transport system permease protein [Rhodobaca bogoriensis DSM 18756]TDW35985.1 ABC-2 type transport system permease protein [Rhodobaca barguzinensis]TDY73998.1 ABC-2 type transport system permease protein [Rhodobaca bogoriensis DSM 18756]
MSDILIALRAELRGIFADRQVRLIILVALVIYALIYPYPYRAELLRDVPVVLVDLDRSTISADLARRVNASEAVMLSHDAPDMITATRLVQERRAYGALVIPEGFERALLRGSQSPVALYADASYFLMYQRVMQGAAVPLRQMGAEVEMGRLIAQGTAPDVALAQVSPAVQVEVPLFNPAAGYATYVLPAAFVLILQQTMLMGLALVATRRGQGLGHPVWRVLGRMGAWVALYALLLPVYLIVLPALYGLPNLGNVPAVLMLGLPFVLATGLLAQCVAALFKRGEVVQVVLLAVGLPFFFLSGFAWPVEAIPAHLNWIAQIIPSTAAIDGLVRVSQMGATLPDIGHRLWHLWGLVGAFATVAVSLEVMAHPSTVAGHQTR